MTIFDLVDNQDVDALSDLLARGADPNIWHPDRPYWTPLQCAIDELDYDGSEQIIDVLLQGGADPNRWDKTGTSHPLIMTIGGGHTNATGLLLRHGCNPNIKDREGRSPLRLSVEAGDIDTVTLLLRHGADQSIDVAGGFSGASPLGIAVRKLDVAMIKTLLQAGADPEALDCDLQRPLERLPRDAPEELGQQIKQLLEHAPIVPPGS